MLTNAAAPATDALPALGLLLHQIRVAPAEVSALLDAPPTDALLVDGRLATCRTCEGCAGSSGRPGLPVRCC